MTPKADKKKNSQSHLIITPDGINFKNCTEHQQRQINSLFITNQASMVQYFIRCILGKELPLSNKDSFCQVFSDIELWYVQLELDMKEKTF